VLTLVIPVYRNEDSLADLLAAVRDLASTLEGRMETVFVVDGSPDRRYEISGGNCRCARFAPG